MAEEHGFQASEGHRLCVNNCGFFGSPATQNMCSKCYTETCVKNSGDSPLFSPPSTSAAAVQPHAPKKIEPAVGLPSPAPTPPQHPAANRCSACRRKVGLTGFRCRCGTTFCGTHRYPEKHGCAFDFKAVGREAIARANPVVKAEKLEKI